MDGRLSGKSLKKNLIEGIISTGVDVIDIGMLPTPLLYFSLYDLDIDNGLMITGSHNPKNFNGIKMVINGMTLFDKYILELYDLIISKKFESNKNHTPIKFDLKNDTSSENMNFLRNILSNYANSNECRNPDKEELQISSSLPSEFENFSSSSHSIFR